MAEESDVTQKKTLRLKKPGVGDDDAGEAISPAPVPAVMARNQPVMAAPSESCKGAAILALVATLLFAALVLMQVMELQVYKYAFPSAAGQAAP